MIKSPKTNSDNLAGQSQSHVALLALTIVDTSWRMFIPTIGGTAVGIGLDHYFKTVPLMTIILITLGVIASGILIYRQLRGINNAKFVR